MQYCFMKHIAVHLLSNINLFRRINSYTNEVFRAIQFSLFARSLCACARLSQMQQVFKFLSSTHVLLVSQYKLGTAFALTRWQSEFLVELRVAIPERVHVDGWQRKCLATRRMLTLASTIPNARFLSFLLSLGIL